MPKKPDLKPSAEELAHWADQKEVIKSNKALKFVLFLFSIMPRWLMHLIAVPVGLFYYIFSRRARIACVTYQRQMKKFTNGRIPLMVNPCRQIISFSICLLEKMEGWLGKVKYETLITHDDDIGSLVKNLEEGVGAILIGSHLGNIELLRSLFSFGKTGVKRNVPVTVIMELKSTEQFNRTIAEINPKVEFNVIDPSDITPETIILLQEKLENGELVVFAADRTSSRVRNRCIRRPFLGKDADFPYGVFLLAALLKVPTYYVFGLRTKSIALFPRNNMFVEKSKISFDCARTQREERIGELCTEFVNVLEKYALRFPYQWYNFYNFWRLEETPKNQEK